MRVGASDPSEIERLRNRREMVMGEQIHKRFLLLSPASFAVGFSGKSKPTPLGSLHCSSWLGEHWAWGDVGRRSCGMDLFNSCS